MAHYFIIITLLLSLPSFAYPTTLHYSLATEPEHLALDSAANWDGEAASDFVVYQLPLDWDEQYWRNPKMFDMSLGSVSSKHFLSYKRLKLYQALTDKVEFRLHWLEFRDFEQDRMALPIELKFKLTEMWSVSLLGMPSFYKSEDDVGASLFWRPVERWELRGTGLWGDFQRNQRNTQADRWVRAPFAATLSATYLAEENGFLNVELHTEPRSRRELAPGNFTDLSYDALLASGTYGRILYERAFYSDSLGSIRERRRYLHQVEYPWLVNSYKLRPGLNIFYHQTRADQDQIIDREVMPAFWLEGPERQKMWGKYAWHWGMDSTVFSRAQSSADRQSWQNRFNAKLDMRFSRSGQLALLFTADLDRLGSGQTWEGGCGQFRIDF